MPLDLETARAQAATLRIDQLLWYLARHLTLAGVTLGDLRLWHLALAAIYREALRIKIARLRAILDAVTSTMLIVRTDETLYWFLPSQWEIIRSLALDQLWAGEHVWWPDGSEQWREFELVLPLVWNDDHTKVLVNIVLYTLLDGVTTSELAGTIWVTPP